MARRNAQEARTQRAEIETKLAILRSQLDRIRTRKEWQSMVDELLADSSAGAKIAEFRKKLEELTKKAEISERVYDRRALEEGAEIGHGIDYTRNGPTSEDPLITDLDEFLEGVTPTENEGSPDAKVEGDPNSEAGGGR